MEHDTATNSVLGEYYTLLESGVKTDAFYTQIRLFTYRQPYFCAPYLELAQYLESLGLADERKELLRYVSRYIFPVFYHRNTFLKISKQWSKKEFAFVEALAWTCFRANIRPLRALTVILFTRALSRERDEAPQREYKNLVLKAHLDGITEIQNEVALNEVCWTHDTKRQDAILFHQDTNAIVLRSYIESPQPENAHDSVQTALAAFFPKTLSAIEDFARLQNGRLGRVALVRLQPHSLVYRHYDPEPWLKETGRYHLVVCSPKGSIMNSGVETAVFQEGDLFFFENKKMHTAENSSDDWRIHVIFDMKSISPSYPHPNPLP